MKHYVEHRDDFWLPGWQEVIDNLNECKGEPVYHTDTDKAKTFGKHVDDLDVYFLQVIGETQFTVWEDDEEYVHILKPGDMLHIPAGLYHDTVPLTPRVGISYGVEV